MGWLGISQNCTCWKPNFMCGNDAQILRPISFQFQFSTVRFGIQLGQPILLHTTCHSSNYVQLCFVQNCGRSLFCALRVLSGRLYRSDQLIGWIQWSTGLDQLRNSKVRLRRSWGCIHQARWWANKVTTPLHLELASNSFVNWGFNGGYCSCWILLIQYFEWR